MKKLFLYIVIFVLFGYLCYLISYSVTKQNNTDKTKYYSIEDNNQTNNKNRETNSNTAIKIQFNEVFDLILNAAKQVDNKTKDIMNTVNTLNEIKPFYVVTEKNDRIIVYNGHYNTVFEYTDIEVRLLSRELQDKINKSIIFYSKEELFDFLESLAS